MGTLPRTSEQSGANRIQNELLRTQIVVEPNIAPTQFSVMAMIQTSSLRHPLAASLALLLVSALPSQASASTHTNQTMVIETAQSHVQTSRVLPFPAQQVWKLIAGFNTLPDYHAAVPASRLAEGGAVRYLTISEAAGGGIVVERLMHYNDEEMTFSYKIIALIESPLPFHHYQAWVDLDPIDENSCKLSWSSKFNAMGSSKEEAEAMARSIYDGCYDGIERVLGAQ